MEQIKFDDASYSVKPLLAEDFRTLDRWTTCEKHGRWTPGPQGVTGEWITASPSIFLKEPIAGDYLWQITATRLKPDAEFVKRFTASKHAVGREPRTMYNFNFWLRAADPAGGDFFTEYPKHLATGWNGMGDDYWNSYFVTVVYNPDGNWMRLRRGPGYEKIEDVQNVVPFMDYDQPLRFSFLLRQGHVRAYFGSTKIFDHAEANFHPQGYLGLCVWHDITRFSDMRLYRFAD